MCTGSVAPGGISKEETSTCTFFCGSTIGWPLAVVVTDAKGVTTTFAAAGLLSSASELLLENSTTVQTAANRPLRTIDLIMKSPPEIAPTVRLGQAGIKGF
ncbi:hypothetical protein GCM10010837_28900 [Aminobacter niigataensis]|nr:protein of unknown function [Aminobacter niigataensis]